MGRAAQALAVTPLLCVATVGSAENTFSLDETVTVTAFERFTECVSCPEMVALPTGSFTMGAPLSESAFIWKLWNGEKPGVEPGIPHEGPPHEVAIDRPFAIARNETTIGEWSACVADGACDPMPPQEVLIRTGVVQLDTPRYPVIYLRDDQMLAYVDWLNQQVGQKVYRLPTEAEWEYAARAGTKTKFAQGDTLTREQANIGLFEWRGNRFVSVKGNRETPVVVDDLQAENPWGIRHMSGNVIELTSSCWTPRQLGLATSSAYRAASEEAKDCKRVGKGGAFGGHPDYARPAIRSPVKRGQSSRRLGFRVLRDLEVARKDP